MTRPIEKLKANWFTLGSPLTLGVWVTFLTAILVPVAIIANFNLFYGRFNIEMAEHWIGYKPPVTSSGPAALSAAELEQIYNKIAHAMNHVCARITGGMVINGQPQQISASGVVIADQYVLTNYHVVGGATGLQVTVYTPASTEATYPGIVVMTDPANDLALLKVEVPALLPSASLGNSDTVNTGDMVFAMGNAFGSGNVFTTGMVGDRAQPFSAGGRTYNNLIRTESYTYPGSSGGPLANINGEIIGINTAIYSPQGKFTGISFAMPINRALAMLQNSGVSATDGPPVDVTLSNNSYLQAG
ncbi:MAG: trypsin-like peptidase domain-containing protein [Candidatus Omnitrophica bacterium]|nr:trypsin-like peptidase domain-containing protein [Candidatus Omnitrophota bacterium]